MIGRDDVRPEFEESQFQTLFQDDLTHRPGSAVLLAPVGQMLEAEIGFDLGAQIPSNHPLWRTLRSPALGGIAKPDWNPGLSRNAAITSSAINLFLQFKRSDFLFGSNAKYIGQLGGPYWRFRVDRTDNPPHLPQHVLLEALALTTQGGSLVRYVAPMCHEYVILEALHDQGYLLENCVYVEPERFAPDHTTCCFTGPTKMLFNPDPQPGKADSWAEMVNYMLEGMSSEQNFRELAAVTAEVFLSLGLSTRRERPRLNLREWELPRSALNVVEDCLVVGQATLRLGLSWSVAVRPQS